MKLNRDTLKNSLFLNILAFLAYGGFTLPISYDFWRFFLGLYIYIIPVFSILFIIEAYFNCPIIHLPDRVSNSWLYCTLFGFGLICCYFYAIIVLSLILSVII